MDYSKFLDDSFDVKEWVNTAFRSHKDPATSKDQYAATLVMKLQMFIQEVNNVIEESSQQAIQNLPRVMREIDAVRQEAALLQEQMKMVRQDIQKVEQNTAQSMQTLLKLDGIKSRMTAASEALKEADNWTTLSADMENIFQSQDIQSITAKLSGMQQSLHMLVDTPDYVERCHHLEKLKDQLEAMLSTQLVAAFNTQSLGQSSKIECKSGIQSAQMFTKIFKDIDRLPQLYKYYHKYHKCTLLLFWKDITTELQDDTLVEWLTKYYDCLLTYWHNQMQWCGQVFSEPLPIVCDLLTESLQALDPTLSSCFSDFVQLKGETLGPLMELKKISERFAKSVENAVEGYMKDSNDHISSLENVLLIIYEPYRPYLTKYKSFEEVHLSNELINIRLDHEEVLDTVQLLSESVNKLFSVVDKSNTRCQDLTDGCCYVFLLEALKTYFSSYCREFRRVLTNIREKCKKSRGLAEGEDWSHFQHSLRIIQTCGELLLHLEELDGNIISGIIQTVGRFVIPASPSKDCKMFRFGQKSPLQSHGSLFLINKEDINTLENLINKLDEGDTPSVLTDIQLEICKLSEEVHKFAFDIVFAQLKGYLTNLSIMEIWMSKSAGGALTADLPSFSLTPQEYITKIGQYMMTLPQHLEPFTMQDNPAVLVALKHGKLPYTDETEIPEHSAELWLESIARGTMHVFCEEILKIHQLTPHSTKQLITDIDYLCNVLDDLGLHASETLKNIEQLLKSTAEEYGDAAEHLPQRLSHAIGGMRSIEL